MKSYAQYKTFLLVDEIFSFGDRYFFKENDILLKEQVIFCTHPQVLISINVDLFYLHPLYWLCRLNDLRKLIELGGSSLSSGSISVGGSKLVRRCEQASVDCPRWAGCRVT